MRRARWCCPSDSKPKPKPKPNLNPNPKPNPKPKPKPKPKPNPNQVLPVRFEATKRSQHAADSSVESRLARAVQLALLLLRRSVAGCAVGSLQPTLTLTLTLTLSLTRTTTAWPSPASALSTTYPRRPSPLCRPCSRTPMRAAW